MWISNTASVAIMVPIALGLLSTVRGSREESGSHEPGVLLLLAYGSAAGGIATMIGTPPNIIGVGLLSQQAGIDISFFDWMAIGLPLAVVLWLGIAAILFWLHPLPTTFPDLGDHLHDLRRQQEGWTRGQKNTCFALILAYRVLDRTGRLGDRVWTGFRSGDVHQCPSSQGNGPDFRRGTAVRAAPQFQSRGNLR